MNALFNYGVALFVSSSYKDSVERFRSVIVNNPRDGESYFILSKGLKSFGDATADDMDNQARRFLTLNNRYATLEKDWEKSKSINDIELRVEQPSRKDFVSVVLTNKKQTPTQVVVSETEVLLAQADTYYKNGNDDEAMAVLRKVLVGEPMSAQAYLTLGKIHLRRGDLEQAVSSFKTALFWDNRLIEAHISLGKIYLEKSDCLQVKNYAASAIAIDENNQEALALERLGERCSK
jgi:tetratricopeptide (TPR) repeat protein